MITAFVSGYETACRIGAALQPGHYNLGFHSTGTVGAFGAAAACARLLGLDAEATAMALGIAGTQAAGLKSQFGTMCKPFHAGKAAQNGLLAARLAARGFSSRADIIEGIQGFALTHGPDFSPEAARATTRRDAGRAPFSQGRATASRACARARGMFRKHRKLPTFSYSCPQCRKIDRPRERLIRLPDRAYAAALLLHCVSDAGS